MVSSSAVTKIAEGHVQAARSARSQRAQAAIQDFGNKIAGFVALAWLGLLGDR
jgi:hypothetical protein